MARPGSSSGKRQVRIIAGPRDRRWDAFIETLIQANKWGVEREYAGIVSNSRAEEVCKKLRTAGNHLGVSVKAYWKACPGCGDDECRYHVCYSVYDKDAARKYRATVADIAAKKAR